MRILAATFALTIALGAAGCSPKPAPVCLRYASCQGAYDAAAGHTPKDVTPYAAEGVCWGDAQTAARCALECEEALTALRTAAAAAKLEVAACAP